MHRDNLKGIRQKKKNWECFAEVLCAWSLVYVTLCLLWCSIYCTAATLFELHLKMNGSEFYWVMEFCTYISEKSYKAWVAKTFKKKKKKFKYYYVSSVGSEVPLGLYCYRNLKNF